MWRILLTSAVVCLSLWGNQAQPQVSVDESKIRATVKDGGTFVSIPVANGGDEAVRAELVVAWVGADDKPHGESRHAITIRPGGIAAEIPMSLGDASIWTRLNYGLTPERSQARAFRPIGGMVALTQIADHVFELKASFAGSASRGRPITVHAEAVHPLTRAPMAGMTWEAVLIVGNRELKPSRVDKREDGFASFTFDVPAAVDDDFGESAEIEISGKRGDFEQSVSGSIRLPGRMSGQIQSDKPIYQPGQTLHVRAVVLDAQGKAAAGAKVRLRVEDEDNERVHTLQLTASRYGVVQDDWAIPATAALGSYQIVLTAEGDDHYQIGRHAFRVSRYELPVFSLTAKLDRGAYLPGQMARVTVTGTYLSGKPVVKGRVRIVRSKERRWRHEVVKEDATQLVAEGDAGEYGKFTAEVDLMKEQAGLEGSLHQRFEDVHFAAYFRDATSGRTEQRRFDIRITREPIHVYVIRPDGAGPLGMPVYISTSYADGRPAQTAVEIQFAGRSTKLQTNKYGVGKTLLPAFIGPGDEPKVTATDAAGQSGKWEEGYWRSATGAFLVETRRTIHRAGEAVALEITAPPGTPGDQSVMVDAIAGGRRVASQVARLKEHKGLVSFPYQAEFRRSVVFVAWNAVGLFGDGHGGAPSTKAVVFPDGSDIQVTATAERSEYKPGEKANIRMKVATTDGKPVEAALGLAVVDQAVLERARTEGEFGRRPWFRCAFCWDDGESEIGGIRLNDLYSLKPGAAIPEDLDLVAEALVARAGAFMWNEESESIGDRPEFSSVKLQTALISAELDRHYASSLEFPQDLPALSTVLGRLWSDWRDPWGKPYTAGFSVEGQNRVITITSGGQDKHLGTADDFVAATFSRSYFTPLRRLMDEVLKSLTDYPATEGEFVRLLSENGLVLNKLRDPWGTAYRAEVETYRAERHFTIRSAGPDRVFDTRDDFSPARFSGLYFRRAAREIAQAMQRADRAPQDVAEFRTILESAGFDVDRERDAWGRAYRVTGVIWQRYSDRMDSKTVRVYGGSASRKDVSVPVTQKFITYALRSAGPDGVEGTDDDFDVARFPVMIQEESAPAADSRAAQPPAELKGTGRIAGVVLDTSGAVVSRAKVSLLEEERFAQESESAEDGTFEFTSLPAGVYALRADSPGFRRYEVLLIPVAAGKTTAIEVVLEVGGVVETVTVEAPEVSVQTASASVASAAIAGTPRVREYFPETLYWAPEIITDTSGRARAQFDLADSVTTWKVAVFASTMDGRSGEAESEFRAFQPFFLDFDPPQVLTEGDSVEVPVVIRNYQDRARSVNVSIQPNEWSTVEGPASRQVTVPSNSPVKVAYAVRAKQATERAAQRITATGAGAGDAIEKISRVHPDGQEMAQSFGDIAAGGTSFAVTIPQEAIRSATRGELRLYPNLGALLLESAAAVVAAPGGCAEQSISAGYANLLAWRFARAAGVANPKIEKAALANVRSVVDGLSALRSHDGGVPYWASSPPDVAVTAYALSFLVEASTVVMVDPWELRALSSWLESKQTRSGTWTAEGGGAQNEEVRTLLLTGMVAGSLASAQKAGVQFSRKVLTGAYHHLAQFTDRTDEPYLLAHFVQAAMDSGDEALLGNAVARLSALGRQERGGLYWDLQTNSPFYGWGTAGRYETTGVVISALSRWRAGHPGSTGFEEQIRRGLLFLIQGRGPMGGWPSTQASVRAMRALVDASEVLGNLRGRGGEIALVVNGRKVKQLIAPTDDGAVDPILVDLSPFLQPGENQIALAPSPGAQSALVRVTTVHWIPWEHAKARSSPDLRFAVESDRLEARAGEAISCAVRAERVGFRGYGMLLAEIGLPPGADVDRASLESVMEDGRIGLDQYEILPDRIRFYLWPKAGGAAFSFRFSLRMAMTAKSAPSILYDYYNPAALSEVTPTRWVAR